MAQRVFANHVLLPFTATIYKYMAKRNQQCVGPLRWELGVKVTRSCSILLSGFEKDRMWVVKGGGGVSGSR